MTVRLQALQPTQLDEFKSLLGSSDFGGCFCAVWSAHGPDWGARCADPAAPNFAHTAGRVRGGLHAGYLAYVDERLVGWTGTGPKTSFPLLESKLASRISPFVGQTWSIGCIAVAAEFRGRRLSDEIIAAVLDLARKAGAGRIEAYPVRPFDEPRIYRGTEELYRRHGFVEEALEPDGDFQVLLMSRVP